MKYIVVLGDGMADYPIEAIGGKTPLEYANTPMMDEMARYSEIGLLHTIPEGMDPGSDTANLSVIGYDPEKYYSGRSPLEALSIGVDMKSTDISFRCNLVTLSEAESSYEKKMILDHSAGEISNEEAKVLIDAVKKEMQNNTYQFYIGTSYRHLLIWSQGKQLSLTPPHDILGKQMGEYLPKDSIFNEMMKKSYDILSNHPINLARKKAGLNPANSIWFWGAGTKPSLPSFQEKTGKKGAMISAVDLLKGIAVGIGIDNIHVTGANGGLNTNYEGKATAAVNALTKEGYDFVYLHVEAPDEMGHQGEMKKKIQAIEYLDAKVIQNIKEGLDQAGVDYRMLILPDHFTPISLRTHVGDPVPYMLYDSVVQKESDLLYNELCAKKSGMEIKKGYQMIDHLLK